MIQRDREWETEGFSVCAVGHSTNQIEIRQKLQRPIEAFLFFARALIYRTLLSISFHFLQQTIGWLENLLSCTIMRSMASIFNNQAAQTVLLFYMKINIFSFHCTKETALPICALVVAVLFSD